MTRWFLTLALLLSANTNLGAQGPLLAQPDTLHFTPRHHRCGQITEQIRTRLRINSDGTCNWDIERRPVTKLVVHHTETRPWASLAYLSRIQCQNLYWRYGRRSTGHYWNIAGRREETCIAYHRIIRIDGTVQPGLELNQIGWNSGDWQTNTESYAVAIVGTFSGNRWPDRAAIRRLEAVADSFPDAEILAHREVNRKKDCPGDWFFTWRSAYLARRSLRPPPTPKTQFSFWPVPVFLTTTFRLEPRVF